MPADHGEIKAVLEEGVEIIELAAPEKIIQNNGKVKALLCSKTKLTGIDSKGRPSPVKINGSEFEIPCDSVIPAIGHDPDIDFAPRDMLIADSKTYLTKLDNVFIGGDALRGASTAINAIADGRKAAEKIIGLSEIDFNIRKPGNGRNYTQKEHMIKRSKRLFGPELRESPSGDRKNFKLVSETLEESVIVGEAGRCLNCDEICNICTTICPNFANYSYEISPVRYDLQQVEILDNGAIEIQGDKVFEVKQKYQILNIANFCNECGNCNTFCPTASAPYKEKPKFYLTIPSFNEAEEGYYLAKLKERKNLIFRKQSMIESLSELHDEYIYETDNVFARFSKGDFKLLGVNIKAPCIKKVQFEHAAEMSILIKGADNLVFD
jgi:putative selenate reductase